MTFKALLQKIDPQTTAFVIGNGINRYEDTSRKNCDECGEFAACQDKNKKKNISWQTILRVICEKRKIDINLNKQCDLSFPEIASLVDLHDNNIASTSHKTGSRSAKRNIKQELCSLTKKMEPGDAHNAFIQYIKRLDIPVITTNFDMLLSRDMERVTLEFEDKSFFRANKAYLWNICYKENKSNVTPSNYREVMEGFGVWHIHGNVDFPASIKIGLEDYVNAVATVKTMISGTPKKGDPKVPLYQFRPAEWVGRNTLLDLFFHRDLIFLGLSLETQEVFLRWLIMQRSKYLRSLVSKTAYPKRRAWYVYVDRCKLNPLTPKGQLLKACGVELVPADKYLDIYRNFE